MKNRKQKLLLVMLSTVLMGNALCMEEKPREQSKFSPDEEQALERLLEKKQTRKSSLSDKQKVAFHVTQQRIINNKRE